MRSVIAVTLFYLCISGCCNKTTSLLISDNSTLDSLGLLVARSKEITYSPCLDPLNYIPDTNRLYLYPERMVRLIYHIMNSSDSTRNYTVERAEQFFWLLQIGAVEQLKQNIPMNLPIENTTPILPIGLNYYRVTTVEDTDNDGYLHHYDDELYYFINKGRNRNNYTRDVIKKYKVGGDSIINIFVMPHHPDSVNSLTYRATNTGIALGNSIKIAGLYETNGEPWQFNSLLNHEIGHVLGLRHSWLTYDGCDDTPPHPNCYSSYGEPPCDGLQSNNMMDYNNSQRALTPCQIGIIHRNMAREESMQRKLLIKNWCTLDTSFVIRIKGDEKWLGARDLSHSIEIEKGGSLTLCCRVSFPEGAKIKIYPGGKLILNGAKLHNDCGGKWEGIEILSKGKESGIVIYQEGAEILNVANAKIRL